MRKRFVIGTAFVVAALLGAGSAAYAATGNEYEFKVNFPFMVSGESFPAGQYTVTREAPSILLIRQDNGKHEVAFVRTEPLAGANPTGSSQPAMTFDQYENQHRLTNVWEGSREGWTIVQR